MDINDLRSIVTVLSVLAFVGIVAWAFSRRNRARFKEAEMLPFVEDGTDDKPAVPRADESKP